MDQQSDSLHHYALIAVIAFCVFANTLGHGFVYDDNRQILMNPLIQRSEFYGKALTSDVWAFKGGGDIAGSNFYRPTFVAWMIVNWSLFGSAPAGWHLTNVLLHVGVCLLLFAFLRRFGSERFVATAITLLFAVHPAHVENVAWLAGSTDTLLGVFLFGSLIFTHKYARGGGSLFLVLAVVTYALALGSKEVALFCVPLYWLTIRQSHGDGSVSARTSIMRTLPFLAAAISFFVIRASVLKALYIQVEDPVTGVAAILTVPKLFLFYLRQAFFPLWLGPSLPIRPVESVDLMNFILPLVVSAALIAVLIFAAKRTFIQTFGLTLFGLTILPVLNPSTFSTEHIAHDRYLYLPIAGLLMIVIPAVVGLFGEIHDSRKRLLPVVGLGLVALAFVVLTVSYNPVWQSGEKLWRHAVTIDPHSANAWSQLASMTTDPEESLRAYERSIEARRTPSAVVGRARALVGLGEEEQAVAAARQVIATDPKDINAYTLFQAYEVETLALASMGRNAEAEKSLVEARRRLPIYHAAFTEKLAVVLYAQNRKQEALRVLEEARSRARTEELPHSKSVLLRLGQLHAELGNRDAAKAALREYLQVTEGLGGVPASDRQEAAALLRTL